MLLRLGKKQNCGYKRVVILLVDHLDYRPCMWFQVVVGPFQAYQAHNQLHFLICCPLECKITYPPPSGGRDPTFLLGASRLSSYKRESVELNSVLLRFTLHCREEINLLCDYVGSRLLTGITFAVSLEAASRVSIRRAHLPTPLPTPSPSPLLKLLLNIPTI